jgi:polyferredoxin
MKRFGEFLRRRQDWVRRLQGAFVAIYLVLLFAPFLATGTGVGRATEALFWGVWWPAVILSMMLIGQFWCGVFCPDGAITEYASRYGKGLKPAEWLRKGWLAILAFAIVTLFADATRAHSSPSGNLIVVGGATALALAVGLAYGRGRRVWCRYLCPTASVFSLLARCSALHFKVNRAVWDGAPRPAPKPVDCPLLLDVRRLKSNEKCNMCARCSGHRDAVELSWRWPGAEIASLREDEARPWDAFGICFVLIGLFYGGFHWPGSWIAILGVALILGAAVAALLALATAGQWPAGARLAYGLIPLAGLGLFLGAAEVSLKEFDILPLLPWLRATLVAIGAAWSGWLGWRMAAGVRARAAFGAALALLAAAYLLAPVSV